ncbi:hypothetical protein [Vibrio phage vB_VpaP_AL-1]|nr:hypothetical protein [Vibrio phage vB_VpaP_AL-1]
MSGSGVLCACLFCSTVLSLAIHLSTYGIYDALCCWLAILLIYALSLSLRFAPTLQ